MRRLICKYLNQHRLKNLCCTQYLCSTETGKSILKQKLDSSGFTKSGCKLYPFSRQLQISCSLTRGRDQLVIAQDQHSTLSFATNRSFFNTGSAWLLQNVPIWKEQNGWRRCSPLCLQTIPLGRPSAKQVSQLQVSWFVSALDGSKLVAETMVRTVCRSLEGVEGRGSKFYA